MSIGLLKWKRMQYGIKTESAIFQSAIEQVLEDITNMVCYQDDMSYIVPMDKQRMTRRYIKNNL